MQLVACDAPSGPTESAPITSLAINMAWQDTKFDAVWTEDGQYRLKTECDGLVTWYRVDPQNETTDLVSDEKRLELGALLADVIPMGGGRVAFPLGSTGRRVYRVWRSSGKASTSSRTKILGVRAGRSRRLPA